MRWRRDVFALAGDRIDTLVPPDGRSYAFMAATALSSNTVNETGPFYLSRSGNHLPSYWQRSQPLRYQLKSPGTMSSDDHDPSAANDETSHGSGGPPLNNDVPLPSDLLNDADFNGIMPLDAQDLAFTLDEILRESGGSSFINSDPLPSKTSDNFNFGEWQKGSEEEGDWDATSRCARCR